MGLDLIHAIPSLKNEATHEYFTLDEFNEYPEYLIRNKEFITSTTEDIDFFDILIFQDSKSKSIYFNKHQITNKPVLIGNIEKLEKEIIQLELLYSLNSEKKIVYKTTDNLLSMGLNREFVYHSITYPIKNKTFEVIYWKEKGYQRKGMNEEFYKDFTNCKLYFKKDDVIKAFHYLKSNNSDFKINFIDNFIEGESVFWGSW